jgi:hypothetical protein
VLPTLALDVSGFEIETAICVRALRHGLKVHEVPSFEHDRIHGVSNLRAIPDGVRVLSTILREWRAHARTRFIGARSSAPIGGTSAPLIGD